MEIRIEDFKDIQIIDKPVFDKFLNNYNPEASQLTFTNLYILRNHYYIKFLEIHEYLCIIAAGKLWPPFAFVPIGFGDDNFVKTVNILKNVFMQNGWTLYFDRVAKNEIDKFRKIGVLDEDIVYDRNHSDYVYTSTDLIELRGKTYDGKRNHIKNFKKSYNYEYVSFGPSISDEIKEQCLEAMNIWCFGRNENCYSEGGECERFAVTELIDNYDRLGCTGGAIRIDGVIKAFTIGQLLNRNTVVIYVEKADASIKGLYACINQHFCENEYKNVDYINREEDLGIEGIRKAKLSYKPIKMVDKYRILFR